MNINDLAPNGVTILDDPKIVLIEMHYFINLDKSEEQGKIKIIVPEDTSDKKAYTFKLVNKYFPDITHQGLLFLSDEDYDNIASFIDHNEDVLIKVTNNAIYTDNNDTLIMSSTNGKIFFYNDLTLFELNPFESQELVDQYVDMLAKSLTTED